MSNYREQAQTAFDNFLLRTYPLFGATLVALAAWGSNIGNSVSGICYWTIWTLFLIVFLRFALAAVATYKYLFALSNAELSDSEKFKKKESYWYKARNVKLFWYISGLCLFITAIIIRVTSSI